MNRRPFLGSLCGGVFVSLAGCNGPRRTDSDPIPILDIFPKIRPRYEHWELTAEVRNTHDWDVSIHDITLLSFDNSGEEVCKADVGNLRKFETPDRTITTVCDRFPSIITAKARETPCDGARISLLIYKGTEQQKTNPNDSNLWEQTRRECNEGLPPERYISNER